MGRKIEIALDDEEYAEIESLAREWDIPVHEWVLRALREARRVESKTVVAKLRAIVEASKHDFPTADIEAMLDEIDMGRRIGWSS